MGYISIVYRLTDIYTVLHGSFSGPFAWTRVAKQKNMNILELRAGVGEKNN
ncbi:MAG: hypothetical protein GX175_07485 [Halanaerobiaceae bacterium]|nr:hypothetical protein [Halanaerobiaceae bacterium]